MLKAYASHRVTTQTAQSTEEIRRQILAIQEATRATVAAVDEIVSTIGEIRGISASVTAAVEEQGAATSEIARSVAETAKAANQMSDRTGDVRQAAIESDQQAAAVQQNAAALEDAVRGLSRTVNRVVRRSSADVNRRAHERVGVDMQAHLTLPGQQKLAVRLHDLSIGGAMLSGAGAVRVGGAARLEIGGQEYQVITKRVDEHGSIGVAFDGDAPAARERIDTLISRQAISAHAA